MQKRKDDRHYIVKNGKVCGCVTKQFEQKKQMVIYEIRKRDQGII